MEQKERFHSCNQCGKQVKTDGMPPYGEGLLVKKDWGYFSGKDGETHEFFLCEACYDRMVKGFAIPVKIEERTELL